MTTWSPVSGLPIQYSEDASGTAASGHYLKFYASGTTTPINMATDSTGATTLAKCQLNSLGQAINGSSAVFIPHVNQKYMAVLYPDDTTADANTFASAIWVVDGIERIAPSSATIRPFATMAAAIAATDLSSGQVIQVDGRANSTWDLTSSGSANGYDVVHLTGSSLYANLRTDGIVNVLALGVTLDGVDTTDAMVYAWASSYDLYIPAGEYYVTETLYRLGVRKHIWSAPNAKIRWNGLASVPCVSVGNNSTTTNYCVFYELFVVDETSGTTGLVTIDAADRSTFYGLFVSANAAKTAGSAVILKNAATCNTFFKPKSNGLNDNFVFQTDSNGNCFYDPVIEGYANSAFRFPLNNASYGVHITGGVIQNDGTGDAFLIEHPQDNLTIKDVYFEANDRDIHINHAAAGISPYVVEGCRFKNPTQAESIYLASPSTVIARGNSFSDANLVNVADASAKYVGEFNESPTSSTEINNSASGSVTRIRQANGSRYTLAEGTLAFGSGTVGLDAYHEASYTPVIQGSSTAGTGTYSSQIGRYTQIGNIVFFQLTVVWTAHTGTGNLRVSIPVASASLGFSSAVNILASNVSYTGTLAGVVSDNASYVSFFDQVSNTAASATPLDTSGTLWVSGHYQVA